MVEMSSDSSAKTALVQDMGAFTGVLRPARPAHQRSLVWPSRIVTTSLLLYALATIGYLYELSAPAVTQDDLRFRTVVKIAKGDLLTVGSGLQGFCLVLAIMASLAWQYRATRNVSIFDVGKQAISPARAVGWWFVPIMFFYKPAIAVSQLWRMSSVGSEWTTAATPKRLLLWWIALWFSLAIAMLALGASDASLIAAESGSMTQDHLMHFVRLVWVSELTNLVPAALWLHIVRRVTSDQLRSQLWREETADTRGAFGVQSLSDSGNQPAFVPTEPAIAHTATVASSSPAAAKPSFSRFQMNTAAAFMFGLTIWAVQQERQPELNDAQAAMRCLEKVVSPTKPRREPSQIAGS